MNKQISGVLFLSILLGGCAQTSQTANTKPKRQRKVYIVRSTRTGSNIPVAVVDEVPGAATVSGSGDSFSSARPTQSSLQGPVGGGGGR